MSKQDLTTPLGAARRRHSIFAVALTGVLATSACASSEDAQAQTYEVHDRTFEDTLDLDRPLTVCPSVTGDDEEYDFTYLNAELDTNAWLRDLTGYDAVSNCADAADYVQQRNDLVAELDPPVVTVPYERSAAVPTVGPARLAVGETSDPSEVREGKVTTKAGVVEIFIDPGTSLSSACTGFLLTPRVVVTAAHCLPTGNRTGFNRFTIQHCDTSSTCSNTIASNEWLRFEKYTGYSGSGDYTGDWGFIVRGSNFPGVGSSDTLRVYQHKGGGIGSFKAYGRGSMNKDRQSAGRLARGSFSVEKHDNGYIRSNATQSAQLCKGDSGGPALKTVGPWDVVVGVFSRYQYKSSWSTICAYPGLNQWHARINDKHLDWIADRAPVTCVRGKVDGKEIGTCW